MSDENILKCPCKECGNNIEYPESSEGSTVSCPHCGQWTELGSLNNAPEGGSGNGFGLGTLAVCLLVLLVIAGIAGGYVYFQRQSGNTKQVQSGAAPTNLTPARANEAHPLAVTNAVMPPAPTNVEPVESKPPAVKRPKSADDLKPGVVKLEKMPGSSLVHASGIIKNDSDYERFGVSVTLDLINVKGERIGSTRDYKDIIEPHKSWQFNALVIDKAAVAAVVNSVKEEQ
jgi:hypothetical protein